MLATSPHRTLDPEEADYFYAPVYASCYIFPVLGWADFPWFHDPSGESTSEGGRGAECLRGPWRPCGAMWGHLEPCVWGGVCKCKVGVNKCEGVEGWGRGDECLRGYVGACEGVSISVRGVSIYVMCKCDVGLVSVMYTSEGEGVCWCW